MLGLAALLELPWWRIRHQLRRMGFKPALPMKRQWLIDDRWRLLGNPGEYQVVPDDAPEGSSLGMIRRPGNLQEDARHGSMLSAAPDGPFHKARAGPELGLRLGFHADRPTDSDNPMTRRLLSFGPERAASQLDPDQKLDPTGAQNFLLVGMTSVQLEQC